MRRVYRLALLPRTSESLQRRQNDANSKHSLVLLNIDTHWSDARKTKYMDNVLNVLHKMAGERQRCMYCLDSHGTDIEHFRPKALFPNCMYVWDNFLLVCSGCNSKKLNQFPVADDSPLLVDPAVENPWQFLDYEPHTGLITAKYDVQLNDFSPKGLETVKILHLDRREVLEKGRKRTFTDLENIAISAADELIVDPADLLRKFKHRDDYGLLTWCLSPSGLQHPTFHTLAAKHPDAVSYCRQNAY